MLRREAPRTCERDPARLDGADRLVVGGVVVAIVLASVAIALVLGVS